MYCKKCGELLNDDAMFCSNCGTAVHTNDVVVYEHSSVYDEVARNQKVDKPSLLLNIVGFLSPLIGWIIWLCLKGSSPIKAKSCGKWATISFVLNLVVNLIAMGL